MMQTVTELKKISKYTNCSVLTLDNVQLLDLQWAEIQIASSQLSSCKSTRKVRM